MSKTARMQSLQRRLGHAQYAALKRAVGPDYDPMAALIRMETAKGYKPVPVGSVVWLPASDWHPRDLVSVDGRAREIRIIAIVARKPRTGAFRRLLQAIQRLKFAPVIIEPFPDMVRIMERWGWEKTVIGDSFATRETQYRPPKDREGRWRVPAPGGTRPAAGSVTPSGEPAGRQSEEI